MICSSSTNFRLCYIWSLAPSVKLLVLIFLFLSTIRSIRWWMFSSLYFTLAWVQECSWLACQPEGSGLDFPTAWNFSQNDQHWGWSDLKKWESKDSKTWSGLPISQCRSMTILNICTGTKSFELFRCLWSL